jgi:FkbM family methyltransferase
MLYGNIGQIMNTVRTVLPNGYEVELIPGTEEVISEIWKDGCYERDYRIGRGDVVVDVGANQGIFSLLAADRGATVFAVEPDGDNFDLLCRNLRHNGLTDSIFPSCCALAGKDGRAAFFIPESRPGVNSSTIRTTARAQIDSNAYLSGQAVGETTVTAITLAALLGRIKAETIALLKIDAEGAEFEILSGVDARVMEKVERLVMETHAAYSERDLFHKVRELGYSVITYDRLSGPFQNGYLFAVRRPETTQIVRKNPIAVLDLPDAVTLEQPVTLEAGRSFSALGKDNRLLYQFGIDGEEQASSSRHTDTVMFQKKGPHHLTLKVTERDAASLTDLVEKTVWAFSGNYLTPADAHSLPLSNTRYEFRVSGRQDFVIPSSMLPPWEYSSIVLGISLSAPDGRRTPDGVSYVFDGEKEELADSYNSISFPVFPRNKDLWFSLNTADPIEVALKWIPKSSTEDEAPVPFPCAKHGSYHLIRHSLDHICDIDEDITLEIHKEDFPTTWITKCVKICFSVHKTDGTGKELAGKIILNGNEFSLSGWYNEFAFREKDIETSLSIRVVLPERRVYQVTWWPE